MRGRSNRKFLTAQKRCSDVKVETLSTTVLSRKLTFPTLRTDNKVTSVFLLNVCVVCFPQLRTVHISLNPVYTRNSLIRGILGPIQIRITGSVLYLLLSPKRMSGYKQVATI